MTSSLPAQPNRSLLEGIEVLLAVSQSDKPVRVRALARELNMTPTRVQRFLGTLRHLGLTEQHQDRRYGVGPGIHALSAIALSASGLAGRALTILPRLNDLRMVVALGVLWRDTVSYFYFNTPGIPSSQSLGKPNGYPARDSSIGLLLLAEKDASYLDTFFPGQQENLQEPLREVRQKGYASIRKESGETSMAVPVGNPTIAGLAIAGNFSAIREKSLLARLIQTARALDTPPVDPLTPQPNNPLTFL